MSTTTRLDSLKPGDLVTWHRGDDKQPIPCTVKRRAGTFVVIGFTVRLNRWATKDIERHVPPTRLTRRAEGE